MQRLHHIAILIVPLLGLGLAPQRVAAQIPALPMPPPSASSIEGLVEALAQKLSSHAAQAGKRRTYDLSVAIEPAASTRLTNLIADGLEAALGRNKSWLADRTEQAAIPADLSLQVQLTVERDFLFSTARLRRRADSVWAQLRKPSGTSVAVVTAEVRLDRTLRMLLSRPLKGASLKRSKLLAVPLPRALRGMLASPVLDVWLGRMGDDPLPAVYLLFRDQVVGLRVAPNGTPKVLHRLELNELSPNPERVRAPLGRLAVVVHGDGSRSMLAAVSDYAHAKAFTVSGGQLITDTKLSTNLLGWPLYQTRVDEMITAPWPKQRDILTGSVRRQRLDGTHSTALAPLLPLHDLRGFSHALGHERHAPFLVGSLPGGVTSLRHPAGIVKVGRHGVGAVVGDMDLDGQAELLVTGAELSTQRDVVTAYTIDPRGKKRTIRRIRVKGVVTALATGDANDDARPEYWLATWSNRRPKLFALGLKTPGAP